MRCLIELTQLSSRCNPNTEIFDCNQDESILGLIHNLYVMTNFSQTDIEQRISFDRAQVQDQIRC